MQKLKSSKSNQTIQYLVFKKKAAEPTVSQLYRDKTCLSFKIINRTMSIRRLLKGSNTFGDSDQSAALIKNGNSPAGT